MIAKELRDLRWPLLAGLVVLALLANSAAGTDLHAVTLSALQDQSDSSFPAVAGGHVAPGSEVHNMLFNRTAYEKTGIVPLSDVERELIIRFLLQDDRLVFFGRPIAGPPKSEK